MNGVPEYPRHLPTFDYVGVFAYFLTFCTFERRPHFITAESVAIVHGQILRTCTREQFAMDAYCYMPDHLHLIITATSIDSNLKQFVTMAKQRTGFYFRQSTKRRLWQRYSYERVLRNDDEKFAFIRNVIQNPLRAELAASPLDYPFWGSSTHSREDLLDYVRMAPDGRRAG